MNASRTGEGGGALTLSRLSATVASNLNGDGIVCVRDVFAIYDNNISPRLIMIIIKTIIPYFIQIRYTDDFPSTGTRLVYLTFHVYMTEKQLQM